MGSTGCGGHGLHLSPAPGLGGLDHGAAELHLVCGALQAALPQVWSLDHPGPPLPAGTQHQPRGAPRPLPPRGGCEVPPRSQEGASPPHGWESRVCGARRFPGGVSGRSDWSCRLVHTAEKAGNRTGTARLLQPGDLNNCTVAISHWPVKHQGKHQLPWVSSSSSGAWAPLSLGGIRAL